jgi:hypothetical protein
MALAFSTYLRDAILNWLTQGTAFPSAPANLYISAHTADPGRTGVTAEVTTTIRVAGRPLITATDWSAIATVSGARQTDSTAVIDFGNAAGAVTGDVSHLGFWDASSGGNCLATGALTASVPVGLGALVQIPIGLISWNLP